MDRMPKVLHATHIGQHKTTVKISTHNAKSLKPHKVASFVCWGHNSRDHVNFNILSIKSFFWDSWWGINSRPPFKLGFYHCLFIVCFSIDGVIIKTFLWHCFSMAMYITSLSFVQHFVRFIWGSINTALSIFIHTNSVLEGQAHV